jgi:hypothetical protein
LIFDQHLHLNPFDGVYPERSRRAQGVEGEETAKRTFRGSVIENLAASKIQISQDSITPILHSSQPIFQPIQHVRHVMCPVVVAAVNSAPGIVLIINFQRLIFRADLGEESLGALHRH